MKEFFDTICLILVGLLWLLLNEPLYFFALLFILASPFLLGFFIAKIL